MIEDLGSIDPSRRQLFQHILRDAANAAFTFQVVKGAFAQSVQSIVEGGKTLRVDEGDRKSVM